MKKLRAWLIAWWTFPQEIHYRLDKIDALLDEFWKEIAYAKGLAENHERQIRDLREVLGRHTDRYTEFRKQLETLQRGRGKLADDYFKDCKGPKDPHRKKRRKHD